MLQSKKSSDQAGGIPTVRSMVPSEGSDSSNKKKEESTETSSTNALEESYVSNVAYNYSIPECIILTVQGVNLPTSCIFN